MPSFLHAQKKNGGGHLKFLDFDRKKKKSTATFKTSPQMVWGASANWGTKTDQGVMFPPNATQSKAQIKH